MKKIKDFKKTKSGDWILIRPPDRKDLRRALTIFQKKGGKTYYTDNAGELVGLIELETKDEIRNIIWEFYGIGERMAGFVAFKLNKEEKNKIKRKIILYHLKLEKE